MSRKNHLTTRIDTFKDKDKDQLGGFAASKNRSKNAIFEMDFKILKPITQMSKEEVDAYKTSISCPTTLNSKVVPVPYTSYTPATTPTSLCSYSPALARKLPSLAFLKHQLPTLPSSSTPHTHPILTARNPFKSLPLCLSHLPLTKNLLGSGSEAIVYKATCNRHTCAVKSTGWANAAQESRILFYTTVCGLSGVVGLFDVQTATGTSVFWEMLTGGDTPYVSNPVLSILEYCENADLAAWTSRNPGMLSMRLFLKWARQIADALAAIHSMGIIHHDIKPHNIFINGLLDVRIGDFGGAKFVPLLDAFFGEYDTISWARDSSHEAQDEDMTKLKYHKAQDSHARDKKRVTFLPLIEPEKAGMEKQRNTQHCLPVSDAIGLGTLAYTAPELVQSPANTHYSFPVDMYSYGVTLFNLITGREPYEQAKNAVHIIHLKRQPFLAAQACVPGWRVGDVGLEEWQFPDGTGVPVEICSVVGGLVERDSNLRPSASELVSRGLLDQIDSKYL